jgi:hypothetical protein
MASCRFFSAEACVRPWLATSISKHWATYHLPSRQVLAVNARRAMSPFRARIHHRQQYNRRWTGGHVRSIASIALVTAAAIFWNLTVALRFCLD